jgi:hypothetical protein
MAAIRLCLAFPCSVEGRYALSVLATKKTRERARPPRGPAGARRTLTHCVAIGALAGSLLIALAPQSGAAPRPSGPLSAFDTGTSAGARVAGLTEELAVGRNAISDGSVIGPDYTQGTLASEAVGRTAMQLTAPGQYVRFTLTSNANAVDLDYALPQGTSGKLSLSVNGIEQHQQLALTSQYSYIDTPSVFGSKTHHFFNDARVLLGHQLHRGDTVTFRVTAQDTALPYTINLADFYQVGAPLARPARSVSVVTEGADPTGTRDSTAAFRRAISEANAHHETVWIPSGDFTVGTALRIDHATVAGAGNWYTRIRSNEFVDNTTAVAGPVNLADFAILGSTVGRHDDSTANAIDGSLGTGSVVRGLWIQNTNVGLWLQYGNTRVTVEDSEILDTDADGVNLNGNATDTTVRDVLVRNTGDDGLAIWSYPAVDAGDTFSHDTVEQPNLANGIAAYGGTDDTIADDVVADTNALGSGIDISNEQFASPGFTPFAGRVSVVRNTVLRAGAMNPNWGHPMGAVQIDSYDYAITGARVDLADTRVLDSPYSAFEIVSGGGTGLPVTGLAIDGARVDGVGTVVMQAETAGTGTVSDVRASHVGVTGTVESVYPPATPPFVFDLGHGNRGWSLDPTITSFPSPAPAVP